MKVEHPIDNDPGMYTIQEAAERTGLSVHTLRYYERADLIPSVGRDADSGHRRYSAHDLQGIEFLKRLRATGMPIAQMQEYVALFRRGNGTLNERREILEVHGEAVRQRIAELSECLAIIEWKIANYTRLEQEGGEDCVTAGKEADRCSNGS
jgi:DNA-binding transcriptional MerR regulator